MLNKIYFLKKESFLLFILCVLLTIIMHRQINFYYYILLFLLIDLVGYIPGRIWNYFYGDERTLNIFYKLYNFCHNLVLITLISLIWLYLFKNDYSFIALYAHLFLDRGIFGNFPKENKDHFKTPTIFLKE